MQLMFGMAGSARPGNEKKESLGNSTGAFLFVLKQKDILGYLRGGKCKIPPPCSRIANFAIPFMGGNRMCKFIAQIGRAPAKLGGSGSNPDELPSILFLFG